MSHICHSESHPSWPACIRHICGFPNFLHCHSMTYVAYLSCASQMICICQGTGGAKSDSKGFGNSSQKCNFNNRAVDENEVYAVSDSLSEPVETV
jgi:hypothetical protein